MLLNSNTTLCYDADFYPFGGEKVFTNTCAQNYKFTGLERDAESGLDDTLYRKYSSNLGRWLSPDRLRGNVTNPQSLNRYAYVANNPASFVDPLGLIAAVTSCRPILALGDEGGEVVMGDSCSTSFVITGSPDSNAGSGGGCNWGADDDTNRLARGLLKNIFSKFPHCAQVFSSTAGMGFSVGAFEQKVQATNWYQVSIPNPTGKSGTVPTDWGTAR